MAACLLLAAPLVLCGQVPHRPTPPHRWELGLHGGTALSFGDVAPRAGWGAGLHLRKAIDYLFSMRAEAFAGELRQSDDVNGTSETSIQTGSLQLVASINNLVWNERTHRRANLYGYLGGGASRYEVRVVEALLSDLRPLRPTFQTHVDGGIGIAFRLSERANIGLEAKALFLFGHDSDMLDGVNREESDVLGYGSIRLNFNLGSRAKSEPLYWVNPMLPVWEDLAELKERPIVDLTDSDADGVADALDQDDATPPGVPVDTRGLPLDSDGDGTPNHLDAEPFGKDAGIGEDAVRTIVRQELGQAADLIWGNPDVTGLFLPNVHFDVNKSDIREADLGSLAGVARLMKSSPSLRVVVTGFADKTASDQHNLDLSYKRARAVIEHLVQVHGLPRSRFLLNYNGEDAPLVPTTGSSLMNRRVELRPATSNDVEMDTPVPTVRRGSRRGSGF